MVQAIDLIDYDHGDDLMNMWILVREQVHRRTAGDPHMDNGI